MQAFGDGGYTGMTKRDENQASTVPWHVPMKPGERRVLPDAPLGQLLETIEKAKASIRAQVEPAFHVLMNLLRPPRPAIAFWPRTRRSC